MTAQVGDTASSSSLAQRQALRKDLRRQRAALSPIQRRRQAQSCAQHALRALLRRKTKRVALYLAYGAEISATPLIEALLDANLQVFVPRMRGDGLRMIELLPDTRLRSNRHGIAEPSGGHYARRGELDAIVIPLLGFDAQGTRLGTGGGYYDRFLAGAGRRPWRLGYAYSVQQCAALPSEAWDVPLHAVCTERGIIRFVSV